MKETGLIATLVLLVLPGGVKCRPLDTTVSLRLHLPNSKSEEIRFMKRVTAICGIIGLTATSVLPLGLRAQGIHVTAVPVDSPSSMPMNMTIGADGSMSFGGSMSLGNNQMRSGNGSADPLQQLLTGGAGDNKHPIIILDSVRASENDLINFAQSLRSGKVRIRQGGVRTITGDSKEAEKYGAKADEKVILISTEPGTAAPAASPGTENHE